MTVGGHLVSPLQGEPTRQAVYEAVGILFPQEGL